MSHETITSNTINIDYNFSNEKYIIGIENKNTNTLVGSKTIRPIRVVKPDAIFEVTPVVSSAFHFKYDKDNDFYTVINYDILFNVNLIIDNMPISLLEEKVNDIAVDWDEKYTIERTTNPTVFKLILNDGWETIRKDTENYNKLTKDGIFSETISVIIDYGGTRFETKINVSYEKSYFEVISLYDSIEIPQRKERIIGKGKEPIRIEGYYNDDKVKNEDLTLSFINNSNNGFTTVAKTMGYINLEKENNDWYLTYNKTSGSTISLYDIKDDILSSKTSDVIINGGELYYNENEKIADVSGNTKYVGNDGEIKDENDNIIIDTNNTIYCGENIFIEDYHKLKIGENIVINGSITYDSDNTFTIINDNNVNEIKYYDDTIISGSSVYTINENVKYDIVNKELLYDNEQFYNENNGLVSCKHDTTYNLENNELKFNDKIILKEEKIQSINNINNYKISVNDNTVKYNEIELVDRDGNIKGDIFTYNVNPNNKKYKKISDKSTGSEIATNNGSKIVFYSGYTSNSGYCINDNYEIVYPDTNKKMFDFNTQINNQNVLTVYNYNGYKRVEGDRFYVNTGSNENVYVTIDTDKSEIYVYAKLNAVIGKITKSGNFYETEKINLSGDLFTEKEMYFNGVHIGDAYLLSRYVNNVWYYDITSITLNNISQIFNETEMIYNLDTNYQIIINRQNNSCELQYKPGPNKDYNCFGEISGNTSTLRLKNDLLFNNGIIYYNGSPVLTANTASFSLSNVLKVCGTTIYHQNNEIINDNNVKICDNCYYELYSNKIKIYEDIILSSNTLYTKFENIKVDLNNDNRKILDDNVVLLSFEDKTIKINDALLYNYDKEEIIGFNNNVLIKKEDGKFVLKNDDNKGYTINKDGNTITFNSLINTNTVIVLNDFENGKYNYISGNTNNLIFIKNGDVISGNTSESSFVKDNINKNINFELNDDYTIKRGFGDNSGSTITAETNGHTYLLGDGSIYENGIKLYASNGEKIYYYVDSNGKIYYNNSVVTYIVNDDNEYYNIYTGKKLILSAETGDGGQILYYKEKSIPSAVILDDFNNVKYTVDESYSVFGGILKDTRGRVKTSNTAYRGYAARTTSAARPKKTYNLDEVYSTNAVEITNDCCYFYDENGRKAGKVTSGGIEYYNGQEFSIENTIIDNNGESCIITGITYSANGDTKNVTIGCKYRIEDSDEIKPLTITCTVRGDISSGGNCVWSGDYGDDEIEDPIFKPNLPNIGDNIGWGNAQITDGNKLKIRHDLTINRWLYGFKFVKNDDGTITIIDNNLTGETIDNVEIEEREKVYYNVHKLEDILGDIPDLQAYLSMANSNEAFKLNLNVNYKGIVNDTKEYSIIESGFNRSSYKIKTEPQYITNNMITNNKKLVAYVVNNNDDIIPYNVYSGEGYTLTYSIDGSSSAQTVSTNTCKIDLTPDSPIFNEVRFKLTCDEKVVNEEVVELLGDTKYKTSVDYVDVTDGSATIKIPQIGLDWTVGDTAVTINTDGTVTFPQGYTTKTLLKGSYKGTTIFEWTVIPTKNGVGKLLYPAGKWSNEKTYKIENEKTPFVMFEDKYFVLTATTANAGNFESPVNQSAWTTMEQYEAIYTKLLVADNGLIGGSVFNGDLVFSQSGVEGTGNTDNYSAFTNDVVDNIFNSGTTKNSSFTPNCLFDYNKGRAWFGAGETIIDEYGTVFSKRLVNEYDTFILPKENISLNLGITATAVTGNNTISFSNMSGLTNRYEYFNKSGDTLWTTSSSISVINTYSVYTKTKVITDLYSFIIDNRITSDTSFDKVYIKPVFCDEAIKIPNKWYRGEIAISLNKDVLLNEIEYESGKYINNEVYLDLTHYKSLRTGEKYLSGNKLNYANTQIPFLFKWDGEIDEQGYKTGYFFHLDENLNAGALGSPVQSDE